MRPRFTTGLPFSLAHTDVHDCRHIPHACCECTIHQILAPRNTSWSIAVTEGQCFRVGLLHALSHARLISRGR